MSGAARRRGALAAAALALLLAGCATPPPAYPPLVLHVAHVNDHHAHLDEAPFELAVDGVPVQAAAGGFARLATLFAQAEAAHPQTLLKLHAGDALTGTAYHALFRGAADAALMNTVCFDAFALGNHEFDDGDAGLALFLDALAAAPPGCTPTPVLAANVHPAPGTPLAPAGAPPRLAPYVLRTVGGVTVAVVGLDVRGKTLASSRPLPTTRIDDETATAQAVIDGLKRRGIRHVVLLTHQGYEADRAMAVRLSEVDVIVGGDSHTLLGDFSSLGIAAAGPYPTVARNRDGAPVCIVQAWEYGKAFGLLEVAFDAHGAVARCGGRAALVLGDERFARRDAAGAWQPLPPAARDALRTRLAAEPAVALAAPSPAAAAVLRGFAERIADEKRRVIGQADAALCLVRVPGEATNRSAGVAGCEDAHRRARGSDAAQAVAEAFLAASPRAQAALQNAGGVRTPVAAGPVTLDTAFTLLPYRNELVELSLDGATLHAALEGAVAHHLDDGGSDGAHPYAAGLRWRLDLGAPRGRRISGLELRDRASGRWAPLDPAARLVVVTNDYIAQGRDGWAALKPVYDDPARRVDTRLLYMQTFADWVLARGRVAPPAADAVSHQRVLTRDGRLLP